MIRRHHLIVMVAALVSGMASRLAASPIQDIVNQVSEAQYTSYLTSSLYTHNGDNRGIGGAQHDLAQSNIVSLFQSFGLTTALEPFTYSSSTYDNVVARQTGLTEPNKYYLIGAHYDSVNNPGADDDASGVAAVLEAARVLSQHTFAYSIVYAAFDREEQGLKGSQAYVASHAGDQILGMIQLDMVAFNPAGGFHNQAALYLGVSGQNQTTCNELSQAVSDYGGGVTPAYLGALGLSDHAPFAYFGSGSCLMIERGWSGNPNYHQAADSVDTAGYLDYSYAADLTRGAVGYLATDSMLVPEPSCAIPLAIAAVVFLTVRRRSRPTSR